MVKLLAHIKIIVTFATKQEKYRTTMKQSMAYTFFWWRLLQLQKS